MGTQVQTVGHYLTNTIGSTSIAPQDMAGQLCAKCFFHIGDLCGELFHNRTLHVSYAYVQTYKHTNIQTNKQTDKQTYIHTYIHAYIHTYIHTYTQMYLHTDVLTHITLHYITLRYITLHCITLHTYIHPTSRYTGGCLKPKSTKLLVM